jgi:DNA-directed RNA polymerase subunit RPC12/RpoP
MHYFSFKLLLGCAECGERFPLDGATLSATCPACHSAIELLPSHWKSVFELYRDAAQFQLVEGKTRGSALRDGELQLLIRWGPSRPTCAACSSALAVEAVPVGGDGQVACRCGQTVETFPPPVWLRELVPTALQVFGVRPQNAPGGVAVVAPALAAKPVLFGCPRCGAGLEVAAETPRILTCRYCESDLYLPDLLWHALHPVKKRAAFWVAFRD